MKYSQTPAGGKAKAGPLRLDYILIWIFGRNMGRMKKADLKGIKQSNMTYAK